MKYNLSTRWMSYGLLLLTGATALVGCPGDDGGPSGAITISLNPTSATIPQGGSGAVTATVTRTGGFTGTVTLTVQGAPTGVTGTVSNVVTTGNVTTATVTLAVGAATALGVHNLTVRVQGTGVTDATTTFALTVTEAPAFTLALSAPALTIAAGGNAPTTVNLTRTNFTAGVTLTLEGAPTGVTGTFVPNPATGTSSVLTVTVDVAVAPGVYNLTVRGAATGLTDRTAALTLTVTAAAADFSLSLSAAALTIAQGGSAPTTVTITRTNFTDAVTLSLGGAPAGVTGAFVPPAPTGTSSVLTVTVGGAVAPGVYNLTVDGTGTPGNRSTPLTLTVTAAANFSLSLSAAALTIAQGGSAPTTVTITRTNFTDAVTLALGGAPAGITGVFVPPAPTGTSSVLTVTVGGAVAPGVYNLTVDGTGTPGTRSTALTVTVTAPGGGNVTVSFAGCTAENKAVWLAFQDGNGPWTRVTGAADIYSFSITSGKGGVAWVTTGTGTSAVFVQYLTQAELTVGTVTFCPPVGNTVTGTAAGVGATQTAQISLGGATTVATFATLPFTLNGVKNGTHDLVAYRRDIAVGANDRGLLRRDLNIPATTSVGTVDMEGAESFAAAAATMTLAGLVGGETLFHGMSYQVGATCEAASLYAAATAAASFTAYGIPAAPQRASDFHSIFVSAITGTTQFRTIIEYFHTLAARTLTLGAQMPLPVITDLGGPYKRLQAVYTLPADYQSSTAFTYTDAGGTKSVFIFATFGYLGGAAVTLGLPDFSALSGWDNSWPPASASTGTWSATGTGTENFTGSVCTENARFRTGTVTGTY